MGWACDGAWIEDGWVDCCWFEPNEILYTWASEAPMWVDRCPPWLDFSFVGAVPAGPSKPIFRDVFFEPKKRKRIDDDELVVIGAL